MPPAAAIASATTVILATTSSYSSPLPRRHLPSCPSLPPLLWLKALSASELAASPTPAAAARKPAMAPADVAPSDVWNMNRKELRALAASLGVSTRENRKNVEALRAACCRALPQAPQ